MQQNKKLRIKDTLEQLLVIKNMIRIIVTSLFIFILHSGMIASRFFWHLPQIPFLTPSAQFTLLNENIFFLQNKIEDLIFKTEQIIFIEKTNDQEVSINTGSQKTANESIDVQKILTHTNRYREQYGLKPLQFNPALTRSANKKAGDMILYQYFSHNSPYDNQKDFSYFISQEKYSFLRVSENLAVGEFGSEKEIVDAWMASPEHQTNILLPDYKHIGASVKKGYYQGKVMYYIVQHFGIPKDACPSISNKIITEMKEVEQEAIYLKKESEKIEQEIIKNESLPQVTNRELQELISQYNATISSYNSLVRRYEKITDQYNQQVDQLDTCLSVLTNE